MRIASGEKQGSMSPKGQKNLGVGLELLTVSFPHPWGGGLSSVETPAKEAFWLQGWENGHCL